MLLGRLKFEWACEDVGAVYRVVVVASFFQHPVLRVSVFGEARGQRCNEHLVVDG